MYIWGATIESMLKYTTSEISYSFPEPERLLYIARRMRRYVCILWKFRQDLVLPTFMYDLIYVCRLASYIFSHENFMLTCA